VAAARSSSDGTAIRYVLPVLWTTSRFSIMQGTGQNQRRRVYVSYISPGGGTGRTTHNIVSSRSPGGGNGGEVCSLRLRVVALCSYFSLWLRV